MRLVVAGHVQQFMDYKRSYGNSRETMLRYVRGPEDLAGLEVEDYVLVGSWQHRSDIDAILKILEDNNVPKIG